MTAQIEPQPGVPGWGFCLYYLSFFCGGAHPSGVEFPPRRTSRSIDFLLWEEPAVLRTGFVFAAAAGAWLAAVGSAHAQLFFRANLNGAQETPPNNSTATGLGTFTLNSAQNQLTF